MKRIAEAASGAVLAAGLLAGCSPEVITPPAPSVQSCAESIPTTPQLLSSANPVAAIAKAVDQCWRASDDDHRKKITASDNRLTDYKLELPVYDGSLVVDEYVFGAPADPFLNDRATNIDDIRVEYDRGVNADGSPNMVTRIDLATSLLNSDRVEWDDYWSQNGDREHYLARNVIRDWGGGPFVDARPGIPPGVDPFDVSTIRCTEGQIAAYAAQQLHGAELHRDIPNLAPISLTDSCMNVE